MHANTDKSFASPRGRWRPVAWIALYIALAGLPLVLLRVGDLPKGGGFAWDFAMALGFGGLAILGLQSALTARFRRAAAPFGVDILYYFHRLAAVGGFVLVVLHYAILRLRYPGALDPWNPFAAPWPMTAGRISLLLFTALVVTSLWRKALRLEYDRWRVAHSVMAVAAVALAICHIWGVGNYTAATWKGAVWGAYAVSWILLVLYVRVVRPMTLLRSPCRVTDVRRDRGRVWTVTVAPESGPAMRFSPGQFAWLTLRASPFRAKEHPFSFSGSAEDSGTLRFSIKELGDFTRTIGQIRSGERAYVDGPHGVFTTDRHPRATSFVFIAGGVGIAPIMSMLRTLADRGDPRPLWLVYGNGCWENVLFREEIEILATRLRLQVTHVLETPPVGWAGPQGVLSDTVLRQAIPDEACEAVFFVCGPKAMSVAAHASLRHRGVPLARIHTELFEMA